MRRAGIGLAGALSATLAAGLALAQSDDVGPGAPVIARGAPVSHQDANTADGLAVTLFHYVRIGAACEPVPVAIRLTTAPAHGTLSLEDGEERPWSDGHPLFDAHDPRAGCGNRLVATRDAIYTPAAGFRGHDSLAVEFTEDGQSFTDTIDIAVR